jgi:uncharacterized protein YceK
VAGKGRQRSVAMWGVLHNTSTRIGKIHFFFLLFIFLLSFSNLCLIYSVSTILFFVSVGGQILKKGGKKMKKLIVLLFIGLLLAGCSSEFYKHDSLFKDWDHVKFSWGGYKNPTADDAKMSDDRGWWGEAIPYIPAE